MKLDYNSRPPRVSRRPVADGHALLPVDGGGPSAKNPCRPDAAVHRNLRALGIAITNGFKLAVSQKRRQARRREIEFFTVDDESEPAKAPDNAEQARAARQGRRAGRHRALRRAMAMVKVARDNNTLLIIPNAGADAATGALCAPNIFRTSFSNWQPAYPMGKVMADAASKKSSR